MAQYRRGTASVSSGSAVVTGVGTEWLTNARVGDSFTVAGAGVLYDVASVASNTSLSLSTPYTGASATGAVYAIARDFTSPDNFPELTVGDIETPVILTRAIRKIQQRFALSGDSALIAAAGIYPNETDGLAATTNGEYFFVTGGEDLILYLNDSGSAVEQYRYASVSAITASANAAEGSATASKGYRDESRDARDASQGFRNEVEGFRDGAEDARDLALGYRDSANFSAQAAQDSATNSEQSAIDSQNSADDSANSADDAANSATNAEMAADVATMNNAIYDSTVLGLSATTSGDYFSVPSPNGEEYLILYKNASGSADEISRYPSVKYMGVVKHFTSSTLFELPDDVGVNTRYRFTKLNGLTPTIKPKGSQKIILDSDESILVEYDIGAEILLIFNGTNWEYMGA